MWFVLLDVQEDGSQQSGPIESISLVAEKCTQEDTASESAGQTGPSPLQPSQQVRVVRPTMKPFAELSASRIKPIGHVLLPSASLMLRPPAATFAFPTQKMDKRFSGSIKLSGWNSCYTEQDREAILYIHGYNSPVEWGVKVHFPSSSASLVVASQYTKSSSSR